MNRPGAVIAKTRFVRRSTPMKQLYLVLAILGAVVPYFFFFQFMAHSPDAGLGGFMSALFVNGATGGFTADLLISSLVFWVFMWSRKSIGPAPWAFIMINLLIGLSCALPAYLYFDARRRSPD